MIEALCGCLWRLSLAEGIPIDDRRLLTALLLVLRAERPKEADRMRLRADDAWNGVRCAPGAHATALPLLAPRQPLRILQKALSGDRAAQARRLRISPALLALAEHGHVLP